MDLLLAFVIFLACVAVCMVRVMSLSWALLAGFFCFFLVGLYRGNGAGAMGKMAWDGVKSARKVLGILLLIGLLTALWRASGTVAFFVRAGVDCITPHTFLLVAFLLPAVFSMAFGSSFGVVGTAGVILMTIARSGGADVTAAVAEVDDRAFRNRMWRDTPVPFFLTLALYAVLARMYPIHGVDAGIMGALEGGFHLSWPVIVPAVALLALPWFRVSARAAIAVSCLLSAMCALFIQHMEPGELLKACVLGYQATQPQLRDILSGGGLVSMVDVVVIVILSCAYSGMFSGTGLLEPVTEKIGGLVDRMGLFTVHILLSFGTCMLFCNQTVGTVLSAQLTREEYRRRGLEPMELAANIGNSTINLAGMVPWAIACSVPLTTMGVGLGALPFSFYLYLLPVCTWIRVDGRQKMGRKRTRTAVNYDQRTEKLEDDS